MQPGSPISTASLTLTTSSLHFCASIPTSANAPDALYWLGRNAERSGNPGHARAYFHTDADRFPQTYFGRAAAVRLDKMGAGDEDPPDFLAAIPPAPALRPFDEAIPPAAQDRWVRAQALRIIAFDASAELELKSGFYATGSPRLLFEAAQAAFDQGHFAAGMAYGRLIVPSFDSRKFSDVPVNVWKTLYPLPYEASLRREAARNNFDPMIAAGLIRQESTFQADAVSHANAIGLMQVLPKTGKLLAKQLKVRYVKTKLFDPEYNLELGMLYIADLQRATGAPEYALAAFNAGEDRIAAWRAERNYEEIAELVESIPFTETRDYVQIVLRNAEVYRMIYGPGATPSPLTAATTAATPPGDSNCRNSDRPSARYRRSQPRPQRADLRGNELDGAEPDNRDGIGESAFKSRPSRPWMAQDKRGHRLQDLRFCNRVLPGQHAKSIRRVSSPRNLGALSVSALSLVFAVFGVQR